MNKLQGVGIDLGTFHSVATFATNNNFGRIPKTSIRSISVRYAGDLYVGNEAIEYVDFKGSELILAPKLELKKSNYDDNELQKIIGKLAEKTLSDLKKVNADFNSGNVVITVPPAWTFQDCKILQEAVEERSDGEIHVRFIHEPIALLISTIYLAQKYDKLLLGKLESADLFLVCDWGAGTVDIALVKVLAKGKTREFSCLGQFTNDEFGGTSIAKNAVEKHGKDKEIDRISYHLQEYWQGEEFASIDFNSYESVVTECRQLAANTITEQIETLLNDKGIKKYNSIKCLLHGGPLESKELRSFLQKALNEKLNFSTNQFEHIGNDFAENLPFDKTPWRRDVLVSTGASLFALKGKCLPEFEYEIELKDDRGQASSSVFLAYGSNCFGKRTFTPPRTNEDYSVDVYQTRNLDGKRIRTTIKSELHIGVRSRAVLQYQIQEAGAGYVDISVTEAKDGMEAIPFTDARRDSVRLPEHSTRFSIDF
jgi:hypothetical protein